MELRNLVYPLLIVLMASGIGGIFVIPLGISPLNLYQNLILGSLGSVQGISNTVVLAGILILTGLSALVPFRASVWNIGAEGQLYMGALAATFVFTALGKQGNAVLLLVAGALAGSLWGGLAGVLKAKFNANEIVTTVFLNYIAMFIVSWSVDPGGPLRDTRQAGNLSWPIPSWGRLTFFFGTPLNALILTALILAIVIFFFLTRTVLGFEIRALSGNPEAAKHAGVNKVRVTIIAMLIGGGLAGLAGVFILMSLSNILVLGLSSNYGYVGIAVAMLANQHPIGSIFSALFFAILYVGGQYAQITIQIPLMLINSIMALTILITLLRTRIGNVLDRFKHVVITNINRRGKTGEESND